MDWSEINLEAKTWILPQERAKNDEAHVVPRQWLSWMIWNGTMQQRRHGQQTLPTSLPFV